jgi:hypothetical protein
MRHPFNVAHTILVIPNPEIWSSQMRGGRIALNRSSPGFSSLLTEIKGKSGFRPGLAEG